MNKSEMKREAHRLNMIEAQARRILTEQSRREMVDKRKKYDWNALLDEYLADEQPFMAVKEFFIKRKEFTAEHTVAKWFKFKTNGWRQIKDDKVRLGRQIIEASTQDQALGLIQLQQVDWIKEKARLARNINFVFRAISTGIEKGDLHYSYLIDKAKNLALLQKVADENYKSTDEFIAKALKDKQEHEEEGTSDVSFVIN